MKLLFRGDDLKVPKRQMRASDIHELRSLNIELIKAYIPYMDADEQRRAKQTILNLEAQ